MRKPLAIAAIAGSLVGGTAVGALAFGPPAVSGADPGLAAAAVAQTDDTDETEADTGTGAATDETGTVISAREPGAFLADALAPLVADGTITQAQADAVVAALREARPDRPGGHLVVRHLALSTVASALGMEEDELREELRAGKTVATVATERGVDVQVVIDAIVSEGTERLDQSVADGRITQEEADARQAELPAKATAFVNGELRPGGPEGFPGGHGGRGPGRFPGPGQADSTETTTTTTG